MWQEKVDYFNEYKPFELNGKLFGRITRFEVSESGDEIYIDLCLTNERLIRHNTNFFSSEGFLMTLISYRDDRSVYNRNRLDGIYANELNREEIDRFISNQKTDYNFYEEPRRAIENIVSTIRPYLFCFEGSASMDNYEFFEQCYKLQVYFQMELKDYCKEGWARFTGFEKKNKDDIIEGDIFFCASPTEQERVKLKLNKDWKNFLHNIGDDWYNLYYDDIINETNIGELSKMFHEKLPKDITSMNFKCFNVGSGLNTSMHVFSEDKDKYETIIKYDIDVTMRNKKDKFFQYDYNKFYEVPCSDFMRIPSVVILSHWDIDHIKAIQFYETNDIFSTTWVAPNITELPKPEISLYAKMICALICINERVQNKRFLFLVSGGLNNTVVYKNDFMRLSKTKGRRASNSSTKRNNYSLALEFYKSKKLLLTGDSDYDNLPDCIHNEEYDVLVVPHHGSTNQEPIFYTRHKHTLPQKKYFMCVNAISCLDECNCCKECTNGVCISCDLSNVSESVFKKKSEKNKTLL